MDHRLLVVFVSLWSSVAPDGDDVRLVGGASRCAGVLEKKHEEAWEPVEDPLSVWNLTSAAAVCRKLDCGSVLSLQRRVTSVTTPDFSNDGFMRILELASSGSTGVEISCSDSVRLLDGTSLCSGRLEVKSAQSDQRWSSVCEADFDQQDAEVVCRELGCGAPSVLQGALYGEAEAPTWTKEFQCGGNESALLDCRSSGSTRNTCSPGKAVGLTCSDSVRLLDGTSLCSGRLEVKSAQSDQRWSSVCEADFDQQDAEVVCRELGCGAPSVLQGALYGEVEAPTWTKEFQCGGHESALLDCRSSGSTRNTCSPGKAVGLTCSGGANRCTGRLELKHGEVWKAVDHTDSHWHLKAAPVICQRLDCGSFISAGKKRESSGRPVWWIDSRCVQSGSTLHKCVMTNHELSEHSLEITCSGNTMRAPGNIRLVGEASRCGGALEMRNHGEWRPVADWDDEWDETSAAAVYLLVQPNISSTSTEGVSNDNQQGLQVLLGSDFTITCSIQPQYPGGSFQLIFTTSATSQNYTQPAVNHSASFLFSAASHGHQGEYRCVYHVYVFSHNFSSESRTLGVTVSAYLTELIIRLVVLLTLLVTLLVTVLCVHLKV
ncbi:hypothetical protein GBF38_011809, partial [Nibea albiflora]